ncbi:MAG: polysaccharide biosynthesis protein [Candidatus Bathyarchaeota archaeon]|nr:MAG: polysaccharide biosynthesis protein [Candidatus Bathyarchaeota archaeon]
MSAAKVARGTVYIVLQNILTSVMGILFFIVAARFFTPSEIGVITTLQFATAVYTAVALLSLQTAATKHMSEEIGRGRLRLAASIASKSLMIVTASSICILSLALLLSPLLAVRFLGDPSNSLVFRITFLSAFFGVLKQMYVSFLQGVQRLDLFAKTHIVTVLISSTFAVGAVILGYGLTGVVVSWLLSQVTGFLLSAAFYRGRLPRSKNESYPIGRLFLFAAPLLLLGLIGLVTAWADRMIFLAITGSLWDLGIYDLAVRGSMTLSVVPYALGIAILPAFSELYGRIGKESISKATKTSTRYLAYLIFPAAIGLAAISETSITFLFGDEYSRAWFPLAVLSVAYITTAYNVIFTTALQAIGETRIFIKIGLATMITQTSLVSVLTPSFGIMGPTIARTVTQIVGLGYPLYELGQRMDVEIDMEATVKAALASLLMAVPINLVDGVLKSFLATPYRFAFDILFGILLYSALVIFLRLLEKKDIELLRQLVPREFDTILSQLERIILNT